MLSSDESAGPGVVSRVGPHSCAETLKKKKNLASSSSFQLQLQSFKWNLGHSSYSCLPGSLLVSRSHHQQPAAAFPLTPSETRGALCTL